MSLLNQTIRLLTVLLCCTVIPAHGSNKFEQSDKLKAAFLFHFSKLVYFEQSAVALQEDAPLTIGIYGELPLLEHLEGISGRQAQGHTIQIISFDEYSLPPQPCQIVFVPKESAQAFSRLSTHPLFEANLIVSDAEDFINDEGCIGFIEDNDRIRFEVNLRETNARKLKLNAKLLEVATHIKN